MSESIKSLIEAIKTKDWDFPFIDRVIQFAMDNPADVRHLVAFIVENFPKRGFLAEYALPFMPLDDFPQLVRHALNIWAHNPDNETCDDVIVAASLQDVHSLHPHLSRIFDLRPEYSYHEPWSWRESGTLHLEYLKAIVDNVKAPPENRKRAWLALTETREVEALDFALSRFASIDFKYGGPGVAYVYEVGFEKRNNQYHQLYSDSAYHILFPKTYFDEKYPLDWYHPSWHQEMAAPVGTAQFGGPGTTLCAVCKDKLDHMITFDTILPGMPVTELSGLSLCTCLSCLGYSRQPLYYQHNPVGECTKNIGYDGPTISPEFSAPSFTEVEVKIVKTLPRWKWQSWGVGKGNLHRIGGHPAWVDDAVYLECPSCKSTMSFLLQLDSDIDGGWLWGSGGICYGFWCDDCKISGYYYQYT